jgi:hypothetical protein
MTHVAVLKGTRCHGYPKWPDARPGLAVPISEVFTRVYPYDAFVLSHAIPEGLPAYRLTKEFDAPLRMALLFADLDAHHLTGQPLEIWKLTEVQRAQEFLKIYPGLLYQTRSGIRLAWSVDVPSGDPYEHLAKSWYRFLEGQGFQGVDHSAGSFGRHMRLPRITRDGKAESPDLIGALAPLVWTPPTWIAPTPRRARPKATKPSADSSAPDDPVLRLAIEKGLASPLGAGRWAVYCPTERHNGGALTSATAVWSDGGFKCFKATCEHVRYSDWVATIIPPTVPLAEAERLVELGLRSGGIRQQLSAVDLTTGGGKSHVTRKFLAPGALHEGIKTAFLSPTNALATQHRLRTGAHQVAGVVADIPDRSKCVQPKTVARLNLAGVSSKYACMNCPAQEGCTVAEGVGNKKLGEVSTHSMLHRYTD